MDDEMRAGRIVGALVILQMGGSALVNFGLEPPLFGVPGFLAAAAPHASQIGAAATLALLLGAVWIGLALTAYPVFQKHSLALGRWLVALAIAGFAVSTTENIHVMSLVSLSQAYTKASPDDQVVYRTLKVLAASDRNWAHFINLLINGALLMIFYVTALRFRLVPRVLAGFGVIAVALDQGIPARLAADHSNLRLPAPGDGWTKKSAARTIARTPPRLPP